jgi:hypothetical protein
MRHGGGIKGLYNGYPPYLLNYISNYSMQFMIYEMLIREAKKRDRESYEKRKTLFVIKCGLISGFFASGMTNCFEVISVRKQANSKLTIKGIIEEEGMRNLMTKGLGARVSYHSFQSVIMFFILDQIGGFFNVDLTE